jgi:CheY-like chemotaxis protein
MMPVMDGWAFRRAQRSDAEIAGIPVIVLTAAIHVCHDELDAVAVCPKPLPFDDVIAVLTRLCANRTQPSARNRTPCETVVTDRDKSLPPFYRARCLL